MYLYHRIITVLVATCTISHSKQLASSMTWITSPLYTGTAQDCSRVLNITSGGVELLVNTSISPYCLQCLDNNMMSDPDTIWSDYGQSTVITPIPGVVDVVNGVLVLLAPMALIMDGQSGSYTVQCLEEGLFFYQNIELFSTSKAQ
jgi:hypothetical protein